MNAIGMKTASTRAVPAMQPRQLPRRPQLLWRFHQGYRRLQLHLDWRGRVAGPHRRDDPPARAWSGGITLGLAGVLLVALGLGTLRRTSGIVWTLPLSANLVLRNFGLTVFLAQVGISSGPKFASTVAETGPAFILLGALILLPLVGVTMIVGKLPSAIPVHDLFGIVSGVTGNPGILAYANRAAPTDWPDIGFAMIFPLMTVLKILFVQVVAALLGG